MRSALRLLSFCLPAFMLASGCGGPASHNDTASTQAAAIDEARRVTLTGNVHPLARPEFALGVAAPGLRMDRMLLLLKPSPQKQAELQSLLAAQLDPHSAEFHRWLTPQQFGARFGAATEEISLVTAWLGTHGLAVEDIPPGGRLIVFSGTAAQVEEAFHTPLTRYRVDGAEQLANAQDPQIPAALDQIVAGVVSLHDFRRQSLAHVQAVGARPQYTAGASHRLFPADLAAIYDLNPLYQAGITGADAAIAIAARSNINLSDVAQFRATAGLSANQPSVLLPGNDPGLVSGDQVETTLDAEWAGAVAPSASVKIVAAPSTATTDGIDLSAAYIVNHAVAPVVAVSYGACEPSMGAAELAFYNSLWQQAAAQGMSVFVASGDAGAAGCSAGQDPAGAGAAVNGMCSPPYATCVGGTQFNEGENAAQYWASANGAGYQSALSYIPEKVWNESALEGGSGLWASGGGISAVYPQPAWQSTVKGIGSAGSMRAVPDVALAAANHDGAIMVENGSYLIVSGTSLAAPAFAGLMALAVQQQSGTPQGNPNPVLYVLAGASAFHATPTGSNSVPGVTGYAADGAEFNLATGLGSVDGALLVQQWGLASGKPETGPDFSLSTSAGAVAVPLGGSTTFTVSATENQGLQNPVTLSADTQDGIAVSFNPVAIAPGVASTVTITAPLSAALGEHSIQLKGVDTSGRQTVQLTLTVTPAKLCQGWMARTRCGIRFPPLQMK